MNITIKLNDLMNLLNEVGRTGSPEIKQSLTTLVDGSDAVIHSRVKGWKVYPREKGDNLWPRR